MARLPLALALLLAPPLAAQVSTLDVGDGLEGDAPVGVAYTPDGSSILVLHRDTADLTFFDPVTLDIQAVVPVGAIPEQLVLTPDGLRALTCDWGGGTLTVVDLASRSVEASVPLSAAHPARVAVSADSSLACVAFDEGYRVPSTAAVVDLAALAEVGSFPIGSIHNDAWNEKAYARWFRSFAPVALIEGDANLLVAEPQALVAYDVTNGVIRATIPVEATKALDVAQDGSFVAAGNDAGLYLVQLPGYALQGPLMQGAPGPIERVRITPDGLFVFATSFLKVGRHRIADGKETWLPGADRDLAIDRDGAHVFATGGDLVAPQRVYVYSADPFALLSEVGLADTRMLAAHPSADELAAVGRAPEELHRVEVNGPASQRLLSRATGTVPEGDQPLSLALDAAGTRAVSLNVGSTNLSVLDTLGERVEAWIDLPLWPMSGALDAPGRMAVVAGDGCVVVVDLEAGAVQAALPLSEQGRGVSISADGSHALVVTFQGRIHLIHLAGAASAEVGQIDLGVPYVHGAPPSSSQGVLAYSLYDGFQGAVALVDSATRQLVAKVDLPAPSPQPGAFDPSGGFLYVPTATGGAVFKVLVDGANSQVVGTLPGNSAEFVAVGRDGGHLYTADRHSKSSLRVFDTGSLSQVADVPLPGGALWLARVGSQLYVSTWDDTLVRLTEAGAATAVLDVVDLPRSSLEMHPTGATGRVVSIVPGQDRVELVDYSRAGQPYCTSLPNSSGQPARIEASGWLSAGEPLLLAARDLPQHELGYFLVADAAGFVPFAGGSQGHLCVGGAILRLRDRVLSSGSTGRFQRDVATDPLPAAPGVSVQPGETWYFQAWFRDHNPQPTSNFTDGAAVFFD